MNTGAPARAVVTAGGLLLLAARFATSTGAAEPASWTLPSDLCVPGSQRLVVSVPGFDTAPRETGVVPGIPDQAPLNAPGAPDLPRLVRVAAGCAGAAVSVELVRTEYEDIEGVTVPPAASFRVEDPEADVVRLRAERVPDGTIYSRDAFWPADLLHVDEAMMGTSKLVRIECRPVQYNPVTRTLRFHRLVEGALHVRAAEERP